MFIVGRNAFAKKTKKNKNKTVCVREKYENLCTPDSKSPNDCIRLTVAIKSLFGVVKHARFSQSGQSRPSTPAWWVGEVGSRTRLRRSCHRSRHQGSGPPPDSYRTRTGEAAET
jgi:hypothetical protein